MATLSSLGLKQLASRVGVLKNDATPPARVPAETGATYHRGRAYDSRRYDGRCYDNPRCDDDWASIRATSSIRTTVKAGTTSARSAGTVNTDN
jgi:hypothetical protein